jgi:hypothetical protein
MYPHLNQIKRCGGFKKARSLTKETTISKHWNKKAKPQKLALARALTAEDTRNWEYKYFKEIAVHKEDEMINQINLAQGIVTAILDEELLYHITLVNSEDEINVSIDNIHEIANYRNLIRTSRNQKWHIIC